MPVKSVPRKLYRTDFFLAWSQSRLLILIDSVSELSSFAVNHNVMFYEGASCEVSEAEKY